MFKANIKHKQPDLFGLFFTLPERMKKQVKQSKEYYFYKLIFSQIDEHIFKVLYSEKKSRPKCADQCFGFSLNLNESQQLDL